MYKRDTQKFLYSLERFGWKLGLENIRALLREIGDPQRSLRCVHVAGTNGKGSTAALLEALCRAAGLTTGLFTSPHLLDLRERIQIDRQPIPQQTLDAYVAAYKPTFQHYSSTFYEALTAIAFQHFYDRQVDIAIIEVGLGGRLDATNVIVPAVSVITEISFDHMAHLGPTLPAIAAEKAGIIKRGVPCIAQSHVPEVVRVLRTAADEKCAPFYVLSEHCSTTIRDLQPDGSVFDLSIDGTAFHDLRLTLSGEHQVRNAAAAALAFKLLNTHAHGPTADLLRSAWQNVAWPGRLQTVQTAPRVVLDVAHNVSAMRALFTSLQALYRYDRLWVLAGLLDDKQYRDIAEIISAYADEVFVVTPASDRALKAEVLARELKRHNATVHAFPDMASCCAAVMHTARPDDLVCVTGSHVTVGDFVIFHK